MSASTGRGGSSIGTALGDWRLWGGLAGAAVLIVAAILLLGDGDDDGGASVPSVVGLGQAAATGALLSNGFSTQVERQRSSEAQGTVIGQDPDAGTELEPGGIVSLIVSSDVVRDTAQLPLERRAGDAGGSARPRRSSSRT